MSLVLEEVPSYSLPDLLVEEWSTRRPQLVGALRRFLMWNSQPRAGTVGQSQDQPRWTHDGQEVTSRELRELLQELRPRVEAIQAEMSWLQSREYQDNVGYYLPRTYHWPREREFARSEELSNLGKMVARLEDEIRAWSIASALRYKLPPELRFVIFDYFKALDVADPEAWHLLSNLSLVSRSWATLFRPLLFRSVRLRSHAEARFFSSVLQSALSSHLSHHVECVTLRVGDLQRCAPMLRSMPSLESLSCQADIPPTNHEAKFPPDVRRTLSTFRNIRSLSLTRYTFLSFSILARTIAALPLLQQLALFGVSWDAERRPDAPPSCSGGFTHLLHISATGGSPCWPLAWILAAASTRQRYRRQRDGAERKVEFWTGKGVECMVRLVKMFLETSSTVRRPLMDTTAPEKVTLSLNLEESNESQRPSVYDSMVCRSLISESQSFPQKSVSLRSFTISPNTKSGSSCRMSPLPPDLLRQSLGKAL